MVKPNQLLSLQTPTQDLAALSFCKTTPHDLTAWLQGLPKANIGELARLLYQALTEINRLQSNAEQRFRLLEVIRSDISFITKQLEKNHLLQSVVLNEHTRKVANLCQALQNLLSIGYKLCITQTIGEAQNQKRNAQSSLNILPFALQRAIQSLYASLARTYLLYYPVPSGLWFELHQLYLLACRNKIQAIKVKEPLLDGLKEQSIEHAYSCALLLGSARVNQIRQSDIALLTEQLPHWAHFSSIQNADAPNTLFIVAPHSDAPPRYKALLNITNIEQLIGFDTRELANTLDNWLNLPQDKRHNARIHISPGVQPTFLALLCHAWGDTAKRDFKRIPGSGTLEVCLGMTALHYHLADQKAFEDTLRKDLTTIAKYNIDNSAPDIWANAFDAQASQSDPLEKDIIEYTPTTDAKPAISKNTEVTVIYPTYLIDIVNQSPSGYCLEWGKNAPPQLQAGDIIGLHNLSERNWGTAIIRWIRQIRNGGAQIGVELLAPNAQPCAIQMLRPGGENSNYLRALFVPEIPVISKPASLITPKIPFQEGSKVNVNLAGNEFKAVLGKRSIHTASVSQYEYKLTANMQPPEQSAIQSPFLTPENKLTTSADDFDSVWKIL